MQGKEKKNATETAVIPSFHLEADRSGRGMSVFISGIISINDFSEELVSLKSHGARVVVSGKRIKVCVYENHTVEIKGTVEDIRFIYGKN